MKEAILLSLKQKKHRDENDVKAGIRLIFNQFKNLTYKAFIHNQFSSPGVFDFIVCYRGYFVTVEAKFDKNEVKSEGAQWRYGVDITESGGLAICINENTYDLLWNALEYVNQLPYAGHKEPPVLGYELGLTDWTCTRTTWDKTWTE